MEKVTLSVRSAEKIEWIKAFAKENRTNVSRLFENYIDSLKQFDAIEVKLSDELNLLKQPGERPSKSQINRHLEKRRKRSGLKQSK